VNPNNANPQSSPLLIIETSSLKCFNY